MKICCCGMAGPCARRSGGLRHSSAEATQESYRRARGDDEPNAKTQGCRSSVSPIAERVKVKGLL